ncbi:MAG: hypothetical protein KDC98_06660 [Planctomycetes bacterium]|nr:hypothetical protein [Planctomycetota bacterium]
MNLSIRKLSLSLALGTLAGLLLAPAAAAQVGEIGRSDVYRLGNSTVGLDFVGWARTKNTGGQRRVDTATYAPLHFLGVNAEMHRLAVTAVRTDTSYSGSYSYKRLGITFRSGTAAGNQHKSFDHTLNLFPNNPSQTFWVVFVPVTVQGNIGFTGRMSMDFIDWVNSQSCALSGFTETYAYAWASAGIGVSGFQAGVRVDLQLGRQKFDGYLGAFRNSLSTRSLTYEFTPVRLLLKVFAEAFWIYGEITVVDRSYGTHLRSPFMQ